MPPDPIHPFLLRHPVSAGTHLLFAAWAFYAALLLRRLARDGTRRAALTCFGASLVLLYLASGAYHAVPPDWPRLLGFFRLLDLCMIHALIAGTCTAALVLLPPRPRAWMLALVWAVALAGACSKWLLPLPGGPATVGLYAAAGLLGLLPAPALARAVGWRGLGWLFGGALAYAVGGTCEALRAPVVWPGYVGPHEVLHLCDMLGSTMHLAFAMKFVAAGD